MFKHSPREGRGRTTCGERTVCGGDHATGCLLRRPQTIAARPNRHILERAGLSFCHGFERPLVHIAVREDRLVRPPSPPSPPSHTVIHLPTSHGGTEVNIIHRTI